VTLVYVPSAWYLKAFIEATPNLLRPQDPVPRIHPFVYQDYGWINCTDLQSANRLLRIYQQYFNSPFANCDHVHSACITGGLAEYLRSIPNVTVQRSDEQLLKNRYPQYFGGLTAAGIFWIAVVVIVVAMAALFGRSSEEYVLVDLIES
jgi:hypothetical protein